MALRAAGGGPLARPAGAVHRVFISHAGEQKHELVDFLNADFRRRFPEVKVFVDELSLRVGGLAALNMYSALQDAFIAIVVLSEDFMEKDWPMEELELVVERLHDMPDCKAKIIPVYYDPVNPGRVHRKVDEHRARAAQLRGQGNATDADKHERWADDLKELSRITGSRPDQVSSSWGTLLVPKLVDEAVELLAEMGELPIARHEPLPAITVGLEGKSTAVLGLLTQGSKNMVLLHGMGGIGKTTLAMAVFNRLHDEDLRVPCCFLRLDRSTGSPTDTIVNKQRELLAELARQNNVAVRSEGHGQQVLKAELSGKKVLLVVDNVRDGQLKRLLPEDIMGVLGDGSTVLVTSCDRYELAGFYCPPNCVLLASEVELMSEAESLELFRKHVWGSNGSNPRAVDEALETCVWTACDGLPKAVVEVGGYLRRRCLAAAGMEQQAEVLQQFHEHASEAFDRAYREGGMFAVVQSSWDALGLGDDQATLLDIIQLLDKQPWEKVEGYCTYGSLLKLENLGLVRRQTQDAGSFVAAGAGQARQLRSKVHNVIVAFCKEHIRDAPTMRVTLEATDNTRSSSPIAGAVRLFLLEGSELGDANRSVLSQCTDLRVLHFMCSMPGAPPLKSATSMRWLGLQGGRDQPQLMRLHLEATNGNAPAVAVVLEQLPKLANLELEQVNKALRMLWIAECPKLLSVGFTSLGTAAPEPLMITKCNVLREVQGGTISKLDIFGCSTQQEVLTLAKLPSLTTLLLASIGAKQLAGVELLPGLTRLEVVQCSKLQKLRLPSTLQRLRVEACQALTAIQCLAVPKSSGSGRGSSLSSSSPPVPAAADTLAALRKVEVSECTQLQPRPCARHLPAMGRCVYHFGETRVQWQPDGEGPCACRFMTTADSNADAATTAAAPAAAGAVGGGEGSSSQMSSVAGMPRPSVSHPASDVPGVTKVPERQGILLRLFGCITAPKASYG